MNKVLASSATFSKDPRFWGRDFTPASLTQGYGSHVSGSDGREFIDWVGALGAITIGYGHEEWVAAVSAQAMQGAGFSLPHTLEQQVADKLVALLGPRVPGWQGQALGVRFGLSGSDACGMAIRLARAVTGRDRILSIGYHGFHDAFVSTTPPAWGVVHPQHVDVCEFGQWRPHGDYAAVIIEQPPQDPAPSYWGNLRKLCDVEGTLLIVDEVVTWPRYGNGGACEYYGIAPDIIVLGKGLGNGIPISCIVGRREYFDWFDPDARPNQDPCFVSSTHFGNAISLAAADAVLDVWDDDCVRHVWHIGQLLIDGLRQAGYTVVGHPPRSLLQFGAPVERAFFIREMAQRGILMNRPNLPNLAHTEQDVAKTVAAAREIKAEMQGRDLEQEMAGKLPLVLFSNR